MEQAITNLTNRSRPTMVETYALNALRMGHKALQDVDKERALVKSLKPITEQSEVNYKHQGTECIDVIRSTIGDESAYIYCMGQIIKHMYLHDNSPEETKEYEHAEWYRHKATEIMKEHKEWE